MKHISTPRGADADAWKAEMLKFAERAGARTAASTAARAQRSSLIKLAASALDLRVSALARGVCPREDQGGSQPLAVAAACLASAVRNQKENK